jgi:hypothetical protein
MVETFVYRNWEWYISAARELVADRTPFDIDVAEFAPMLGTLVTVNQGGTRTLGPVLVCELTTPVDGHPRLLIDGWHRLQDAADSGVVILPALILTAAEGLSVSGRVDCYGCGHCKHVQFDGNDDEDEPCYHYCTSCEVD